MNTSGWELAVSEEDWRSLQIFNWYRVMLGSLFVALMLVDWLPPRMGLLNPQLFLGAGISLLVFSLLGTLLTHYRFLPYVAQVTLYAFADIVLLTMMMYGSGGMGSGLELLLLVNVAGHGVLAGRAIVFLYASMAVLAVTFEEVYLSYSYAPVLADFGSVALFSLGLLTISALCVLLSKRYASSQALAWLRSQELRTMSLWNEQIVRMMRTGIIVLGDDMRIRLANYSARKLLGLREDSPNDISLPANGSLLTELVNTGQREQFQSPQVFQRRLGGVELQISVVRLEAGRSVSGWLLVLEDSAVVQQRALQLKHASLGRLTASISHEIRNPLGVISHAIQLLAESMTQASTEDRRLIELIQRHVRRLNEIVENVMQLSRRRLAHPNQLQMEVWLKEFADEFVQVRRLQQTDVRVRVSPPNLCLSADASQLYQILWNLGENAIRYSFHSPLLELCCGIQEEPCWPYIDVIDRGPGIAEDAVDRLFEPFFTTETEGSGLGLYLAHELCESNQASLRLLRNTPQGCCFRINFDQPAILSPVPD